MSDVSTGSASRTYLGQGKRREEAGVSTVETGRGPAEIADALVQVEANRDRLRRSEQREPDAYIAPTVWERYDAKLTALRWLLGQEAESPITKQPCVGPPDATDIYPELSAARRIQYPGHRRGE